MKWNAAAHIAALVPYPPGKPLEELEREYGITDSIKLASNENPWGPSPKAMGAITAALANLHRYPDGSCYYLGRRLAEHLGVRQEEIVFGNGSNELIQLLCQALLEPDDEVISSHPTFLMYQKIVQVQGGSNTVIPLRPDRHHDLDRILGAMTDRTRLVFLDNPNNPCGTLIERQRFLAFLDAVPAGVVVVLDEAYIDFVQPELRIDLVELVRADKPVVGLRTFSKAYGLAGLRVGYGLMDPELAGLLHRVRQPFNVNALAQIGALAALDDEEHYQQTLDKTRAGMAWLAAEVAKLGCRPYPSHTNFFLIDVYGNAQSLYKHMLRQGVIVRAMQAYGFPEFIRITVGTATENQRFVKAMEKSLHDLAYA